MLVIEVCADYYTLGHACEALWSSYLSFISLCSEFIRLLPESLNMEVIEMTLQQRSPRNAHIKRNSWCRGNGSYSYRGELRHGISLRKSSSIEKSGIVSRL